MLREAMQDDDTDEKPNARRVLSDLEKAEDAFREWESTCKGIDEIYNIHDGDGLAVSLDGLGLSDNKLDLFWSSYEILKPAVYAKPPQPVVSPLFADNDPLFNTTAELLERVTVSTFKRTCIDDVMKQTRDDVIFDGRGQVWVYYLTEDGQRVEIGHKDRCDFLHEPARYWSQVGWVAGAEHLDKDAMKKRFDKLSDDDLEQMQFNRDRDADGRHAVAPKCKVWEVWHKADQKVYWVTKGYDKFLDEDKPYVKLEGFWPCPRPAYGTTARRSLIPVPDYLRYASHFQQISTLTSRIYTLLDSVKMKGLIPGSGDVATAVDQLLRSNDDSMVIPVPGMALGTAGANAVVWLPLDMVANAITGLITARQQLIDDFYQLSGISDIMRGATDADETLGAQQLKSQYGSVRVREKVQELQRIAADAVGIAAEIIADNFSQKNLLDMSLMAIPTKAELSAQIKKLEDEAEKELKALGEKAQEAAQSPQAQETDPAQAQQAFQQAQQQILQKYAPMLMQIQQQVPIEDVMKLLRDDRARGFTFEIESSSTIMTDEMQEKQSRNEFVEAFTAASQAMMGLAAQGEQGAKLAGALMKFQLAPYRAGRELGSIIDEYIDAAPEIAAKMAAEAGTDDANEGLVEAQKALAEAEQQKAQAAMAKVQADAQFKQAENQRKFNEMQMKQQADEQKHQAEVTKLQQAAEKQAGDFTLLQAQVDKLRSETYKTLVEAGIAQDRQAMDEFKTVADVDAKRNDQAMAVQGQQQEAAFRANDAERAARGEDRADRQQDFSEQTGERQMSLAESQAEREGNS